MAHGWRTVDDATRDLDEMKRAFATNRICVVASDQSDVVLPLDDIVDRAWKEVVDIARLARSEAAPALLAAEVTRNAIGSTVDVHARYGRSLFVIRIAPQHRHTFHIAGDANSYTTPAALMRAVAGRICEVYRLRRPIEDLLA